ncbi:hypothetical protein AB0395_29710 [Streptosporangium sp. NPDC051023]|uniref:hypothetical protein n=1 Tax=Streptosporangium sp. NPDC051023 TaxID=3155410 RepID=UPI00344CDF26
MSLSRRVLDTVPRPGHLVHGEKLPVLKKAEDAYLDDDRKHGMTRSARDGYDRRPAPAHRRPEGGRP